VSDQDPGCGTPDTSPAPGTRAAFAAALLTLVGWNGTEDRYLVLIDPGGSAAERRALGKESDCIVGALGAEELFFDVRRTAAYVFGSAPALLERRAGGTPMAPAGAMRRATRSAPPDVADLVWYGKSPAVQSEHVEHVVDVRLAGTGAEVDVVAFGERVLPGESEDYGGAPVGTEVCKQLTRTWDWTAGFAGPAYYDRATGRPVIGVVDFELLKERLGVLPPAA
jgi:hypothetical protein